MKWLLPCLLLVCLAAPAALLAAPQEPTLRTCVPRGPGSSGGGVPASPPPAPALPPPPTPPLAQQPSARPGPTGGNAAPRPQTDKLTSPRETVKTLYFSVIAYDFRPHLIQDAIACLELDPALSRSSAEAALLAIQLEEVLKSLSLPLCGLPERTDLDRVVLYDSDGFHIGLHRGETGQWRFDRDTIARLPLMHRQILTRQNPSSADRTGLREPYTDPRSTMKRFLHDFLAGDFYAAAQALDLSSISTEQRTEAGTLLAHQLAYVIQRRGWVFQQEIPSNPAGAPYTWYADDLGRIMLERVAGADGKDAWLFSKRTVRNISQMYEQVKSKEPDVRYVWLGKLVPAPAPVTPGANAGVPPLGGSSAEEPPKGGTPTTGSPTLKRPDTVPAHLGSPRDMLKSFYRTMDASQARDSRLVDALEYLDLQAIAPADRKAIGAKLADNLEAVLRKLAIDLATVPSDWNSPPQVLSKDQSMRIEIVRQRDGCWRFSQATVAQIPAMYARLASREQADRDRGSHLESPRECLVAFLDGINRFDEEQSARCLDLSAIHPGAQSELGPVLAFKLKWIIDRLVGRLYIQEIPDEAEGPHYNLYRGEKGRIVVARQTAGPRKGEWLFTVETVTRIEPMFRKVIDQPTDETLKGVPGIVSQPSFWGTPGIWLRLCLPQWLRVRTGGMDLYQWLGLVLAVLVAGLTAKLLLSQLYRAVSWLLHRTGSVLTSQFIAQKLRPLTWVLACWLLFELLSCLDLPLGVINTVLPLKKFLMAGLLGWLGFQLIDLCTGIYINSELLRPHRNLSDMIVPVTIRLLKGTVVLLVLTYVIYQIGEGESLGRFLTGLGVAGLAASLAAQDIIKSFFGTLLLIGERSFKLGDRIMVEGKEGTVEQVGFRSTRLRRPDGSVVSVPNSVITSAAINNLGTQTCHPLQITVGLGLDTPAEQVLALRDQVREWLSVHPKIDPEQLDLPLERVAGQGVKLSLLLQLKVADAAEEKQVRDQINAEVSRCARELGIDLSGWLKQESGQKPDRPGYVLDSKAA